MDGYHWIRMIHGQKTKKMRHFFLKFSRIGDVPHGATCAWEIEGASLPAQKGLAWIEQGELRLKVQDSPGGGWRSVIRLRWPTGDFHLWEDEQEGEQAAPILFDPTWMKKTHMPSSGWHWRYEGWSPD